MLRQAPFPTSLQVILKPRPSGIGEPDKAGAPVTWELEAHYDALLLEICQHPQAGSMRRIGSLDEVGCLAAITRMFGGIKIEQHVPGGGTHDGQRKALDRALAARQLALCQLQQSRIW